MDTAEGSDQSKPAAQFTVDTSALDGLVAVLQQVEEESAHVKSAAFQDDLIEALKSPRIDGREVGLDIPVRIVFADDITKDMFLRAGGRGKSAAPKDPGDERKQEQPAADVEALADILVKAGMVVSPLRG